MMFLTANFVVNNAMFNFECGVILTSHYQNRNLQASGIYAYGYV